MKFNYLLILLSFLFLYSCNNSPHNTTNNRNNEYIINGYVINKDNEIVLLSDSVGNELNRATVRENRFSLIGKPNVNIAFLHFKNDEKHPIFLDALTYEIRVWDNNPNRFFINSSHPGQLAYNEYQKELANIDRKLFLSSLSATRSNTSNGNQLKKPYTSLINKRKKLSANYIKKNTANYISLFELNRSVEYLEREKVELLYSALDTVLLNTPTGTELTKKLKQLVKPLEVTELKSEKITVDKTPVIKPTPKPNKPERLPASQFSGLSPEGYLVDLQDIVSKNKVVMLDFWGSWCQPCRMQNPFWNRQYKKYHDKGFEIISIAEETEESRPYLEGAISEDNMIWQHIVDENHAIAELYRAFSLPHAVLIDNEGRVIYYKATARDVQEFLEANFAE
ncbi:thiol-disulfide isomerase/thioredoxin [Balneicella halophila]|uniref:Thiol-disulfide isomerase/thioredoxin n=1 Tax=Balneicella halophila TaxID=1537566 RepID=A0A7L4UMV7_BALHA|nr:TlpA disulfide reductase family protein [Balneicella halophila]PVX49956.1 thiol-disulfide isomerase/thioredoxin [Balneicella halophila]